MLTLYNHNHPAPPTQQCLAIANPSAFCHFENAIYTLKNIFIYIYMYQRRQWHPTPVLLPGESHGWRSLVGSMGLRRVGHDWATSLSLFTFMHWRKKWQPTLVFLPGESQGQELGGLPSIGSHRVGHDWSDLAAATLHCNFTCLGAASGEGNGNPLQYFCLENPMGRGAW